MGSSPKRIQEKYDENLSYQRSPPALRDNLAEKLHDPEVFIANLFKGNNYPDFLKFFTEQIEEKGYEDVLNEFIFKGDKRADIMFNRLFAGMLLLVGQLNSRF